MSTTLVSEYLKAPFGTLADLIRLHARQRPSHTALLFEDSRISYAELDGWADRVAVSLQRDGLKPNDVVAISASTSLAYVFAMIGSLRAGLTVAPIATDMTAANLTRMIVDSGAKRLFLDQPVAEMLSSIDPAEGVSRIALDNFGATRWTDWLVPAGSRPQDVQVRPDDAFNIIYSSGTTGTPKGIMVPHSFRWAQFQLFQGLNYDADSVAMVSIPLYSNMTLSSFLPPLAMGCTIVLMKKFDARRYLELAEKHRVTHSMMVPVQFQRIMAVPDFDRFDLSAFRMKSCGSAHFSPALKAEILARWPGELFEYYGMTEGGGVCVLDARRQPNKLHTVGRPAAGNDMRVIDENGKELPAGAIGEIVGHSPTMMVGYRNLPDKTREAEWFDSTGKRFIRTGDIGRFDEDGFLMLLDRKKEMIISGGFNVYPSDIEGVLRDHPDILEVAVTGVPSTKWGETPVAFIVPRAGVKRNAEELMAWSRERLGKPQRLAAIEFLDELPRGGIGKVLKDKLRERWVKSRGTL